MARTGNFSARLIGPLAPGGAFIPGGLAPGAIAPAPISPNGLDPIFGPELAPRYEIRYTPGGGDWNFNFEGFPPSYFGGGSPFIGGGEFPLEGNFGGAAPGFPFFPPFDNKTTPSNGNGNGIGNGNDNGGGSIEGKKGDSEPEKYEIYFQNFNLHILTQKFAYYVTYFSFRYVFSPKP